MPLTDVQRRAFRHALSQHEARGPDQDGWHQVTTADGGTLALCARRLDDDPELDGVTIVMDRPTPQTSGLVHELMSANEMLLLPLAAAPSASVAAQVTETWPIVRRVESTGDLQQILVAGAHVWWMGSD